MGSCSNYIELAPGAWTVYWHTLQATAYYYQRRAFTTKYMTRFSRKKATGGASRRISVLWTSRGRKSTMLLPFVAFSPFFARSFFHVGQHRFFWNIDIRKRAYDVLLKRQFKDIIREKIWISNIDSLILNREILNRWNSNDTRDNR